MPTGAKIVFRFGAFEANAESGELRKSGIRIRLTEQAFRVLQALLERPDEVVSREELKQKLWPEDTFVDFDHSLNTVINKLREALGDSATSPRYIETLARRGYRFLPPVVVLERSGKAAVDTSSHRNDSLNAVMPRANIAQGQSTSPFALLTRPEELPSVRRPHVHFLFLLIQCMYLVFYLLAFAHLEQLDATIEKAFGHLTWAAGLTLVSALVGLPLRLYLITAVVFAIEGFSQKFRRIFLPVFLVDELWALAPLLLTARIGVGLALGATAALVYVPFAERSLVLMADRATPA
jgi:cholera toxin transcriptional activator